MYRVCILFYLFLLVKCIYCNDTGNSCKIQGTNETGTCLLLKNCPHAIHLLLRNGKPPQICGFQNSDAVICCVESNMPAEINTTSTESVENKDEFSRSEQKCKEYAKYAVKTYPSLLVELPDAAVVNTCSIYTLPLILGANEDPVRYPHMALIGFEGMNNETQWLCSGSLISENFVLTAAHCLYTRENGAPKFIRLGDVRRNSNIDKSFVQDFTIKRSFAHPEYKVPSLYNDIGLLQMERTAILNERIRPICLTTSKQIMTNKTDVTNWSSDIYFSRERHLVQYSANIVPNNVCSTWYNDKRGIRLKYGILDNKQICVASSTNSKGLCDDETSGGPLQILNTNVHCSYTIIGVSSFGSTCSESIPKIYTKVSYYTKWIEDIVFKYK